MSAETKSRLQGMRRWMAPVFMAGTFLYHLVTGIITHWHRGSIGSAVSLGLFAFMYWVAAWNSPGSGSSPRVR